MFKNLSSKVAPTRVGSAAGDTMIATRSTTTGASERARTAEMGALQTAQAGRTLFEFRRPVRHRTIAQRNSSISSSNFKSGDDLSIGRTG